MLARKKEAVLILAVMTILSFVSLVSAIYVPSDEVYIPPAEGTTRDSVNGFFDALQKNSVVRFIVGDFSTGEAGESEIFFIKVLVFILLVLLVGYAVRRVPGIGDRDSLVVLIAIIVSLIAVRYITSPELVNFIWLPYGVLGIFLASILPFILGFFFIKSFPSRIFRKISWSLYVVIFAGLAWFRWDSLKINLFGATGAWYENGGVIYLATAALSFLLIVFDNQIRGIMHRARYKDIADKKKKGAAIAVDIKIEDLYDKLARTTNPTHIEFLKSEINRLEADRNRILR